MQEPHWIRHSHGNDVRTKKIDDSGEAKFIGPSQAMKDALEAEGLHVTWPDNIYSYVAATFSPSYDSEYDVTINLGWDEEAVKTSSDVDSAIAQRLYSVYRDYADHPWRYELDDRILEKWHREQKLNWGRILGLIDARELAEKLLYWFSCVAGAVADGRPIPPKELRKEPWETIHISLSTATKIRDCLKKTCATMNLGSDAKEIVDIIDILAYKLDIDETFNNEKQ